MFSQRITQWLVARSRTSRRHSPWNLLLGPATLVWFAALSYALFRGAGRIRAIIHPDVETPLLTFSFSGFLVVAGIVVAALMPAFLLANVSVWIIPRARRAMDREAREHPGAGFRESNVGLLKSALVLVPLGIVIALGGVWLG